MLNPEIDRVDRLTMESSRVDWPVKSRVDRSSRSYVFEVEPVDFQHLWSEWNRFGNHPHHAFVSGVFKAGSEDDMKLIGRLFVRTGNTRSLSSDFGSLDPPDSE